MLSPLRTKERKKTGGNPRLSPAFHSLCVKGKMIQKLATLGEVLPFFPPPSKKPFILADTLIIVFIVVHDKSTKRELHLVILLVNLFKPLLAFHFLMEDLTDFIKFFFQQIEELDDFFAPHQIQKLKEIIEAFYPSVDVSDILVKIYE